SRLRCRPTGQRPSSHSHLGLGSHPQVRNHSSGPLTHGEEHLRRYSFHGKGPRALGQPYRSQHCCFHHYSMGLDERVNANKVGFIMDDQCFEFVSQFSDDGIAAFVELHELAPMDPWSPQEEPALQFLTRDLVMKPQSPNSSSQFITIVFERYDEDTASLEYVFACKVSSGGKRHILSIAQGCLANTAIAEQ